MKAFLLAAGEGTRLRPITNSIPKCLVPICGKPMLGIWLELCRRSGIDEVLVNLHAHADAVRRFLSEHDFGVNVRISEEPVLLGSAGTLFANRQWVEPEPYFWVFYADVLTNMDLGAMRVCHERSGMAATLGVYNVPDPSRCGIAQVDEHGIVHKFVEKPATPMGSLAFSGVMIMCREVIRQLPTTAPTDLGFEVIPRLGGRMVAYRIREYLLDIGTMANYERAQMSWPGLRETRETPAC
jgi:mannose-1-phosphate guanylyltransferase